MPVLSKEGSIEISHNTMFYGDMPVNPNKTTHNQKMLNCCFISGRAFTIGQQVLH